MCYLQRGGLPVYRSNEDHQHVVDAQVAKDITLGHRDVQTQDLQHVLNRLRAVLVQLETHNQKTHINVLSRVQKIMLFSSAYPCSRMECKVFEEFCR